MELASCMHAQSPKLAPASAGQRLPTQSPRPAYGFCMLHQLLYAAWADSLLSSVSNARLLSLDLQWLAYGRLTIGYLLSQIFVCIIWIGGGSQVAVSLTIIHQ